MEWDAIEGTSKHNMGWRRINRAIQLQHGNWSVLGKKEPKIRIKTKFPSRKKKTGDPLQSIPI